MTSKQNQIRDLLPAYIKGELSADQRRSLEEALDQDPELRSELELERGLQGYYQELKKDPPKPSPRVWERIGAEIESPAAATSHKRQPQPEGTLLEKFKELWRMPALSWGLVGAQCLLLLILLSPGSPKPIGKTLSGSSPALNEAAQINLVFKEQTSEIELRELIRSINGTIVGGPTATGLYSIAIDSAPAIDQALKTLQHHPRVMFAELKP